MVGHGRTRRTAAGVLMLAVLSAGAAACTGERSPAEVRRPTDLSSSPTAAGGTDDALDLPTPPPVPESVVQPRWDPRAARDLPAADVGLPESLDPPPDAAELTSVPGVVALVEGRQELDLVDVDGRWWRLPLPEQPLPVPFYAPATTSLTRDGTHVVFLGRTAMWSRDVRAAEWRALDYPDGFLRPGVPPRRGKVPQVVATAGGHVWLGRGAWWSVDLDAATVERSDSPSGDSPSGQVRWGGDDVYVQLAVEPAYDLTLLSWGDWGAPVHTFRTDGLSTLSNIAADAASVVAVRGACTVGVAAPEGPSRRALVALDLDDLSARGYLPVRDPFGDYTCGSQLLPVGWIDPQTVLVTAAVTPGSDADGRTFVTWDVESGELRRVAAMSTDRTYDVALGVLGGAGSRDRTSSFLDQRGDFVLPRPAGRLRPSPTSGATSAFPDQRWTVQSLE